MEQLTTSPVPKCPSATPQGAGGSGRARAALWRCNTSRQAAEALHLSKHRSSSRSTADMLSHLGGRTLTRNRSEWGREIRKNSIYVYRHIPWGHISAKQTLISKLYYIKCSKYRHTLAHEHKSKKRQEMNQMAGTGPNGWRGIRERCACAHAHSWTQCSHVCTHRHTQSYNKLPAWYELQVWIHMHRAKHEEMIIRNWMVVISQGGRILDDFTFFLIYSLHCLDI